MKILLSVSTGFLAHTLAPVTPLLAMAGAASEVADLWRLKSASCHSFSLAPKNEEMSEFCWFFRLSQSMKMLMLHHARSCVSIPNSNTMESFIVGWHIVTLLKWVTHKSMLVRQNHRFSGRFPTLHTFFKAASMKLQTRGRKWSELGSNEVTIFQNNAVGNFPLFAFIYFKESFRTWEMHIKNVKFCRKMASIFATTLLLLLQCLLHIKLYILAEQSCRVPPE